MLEDASRELNEPKLNHDSKQLIVAVDTCLNALEHNAKRGIIAELIEKLGDLSDTSLINTTVGGLNHGVNQQNPDQVKKSAETFQVESAKLNKLLDVVLQTIDPSHPSYSIIQALSDRAKLGAPLVNNTAKLYLQHPNDTILSDHLQNVIQTYTEATRGLQKQLVSFENVYTTPELIQSCQLSLDQHTKALQKALARGDAEAAAREHNLISIAANQLLNISEKEKDNSEDPVYRSGLETELGELRSGIYD